MKKIIDFITNLLNRKEKNKLIETAIYIVIIGIIIVIAGGTFFENKSAGSTGTAKDTEKAVETAARNDYSDSGSELEKKASAILSQIDGAGKVEVMITYLSGREVVPAFDLKRSENGTEERDTGGGTRNIRQNELENKIAYEEQQGGVKKPIILKEKTPEVKGVVVVAEGAGDLEVKEKLCKAVQTLLDVPVHRIQVFEKEDK